MRYAFFLVALVPLVLASVNFDTCLVEVRNGTWGTVGGTDNEGNPVSNISEATAITYELCLTACGAGPEPFDWNIFSQQFSSWLLPYLAMVSQLPFGANNRLDNLVSMLLTMGSPTLAAYSLALTVLNGAWVARRFSHLDYPNTRNAVKILSSLQQSSFRVVADDALLASLIVLPENDEWWSELVLWLNYVHTWSISAVASIIWVLVAYVFTVVDSFTGVVTYSTLNANGQAVGSIFLWLLPIVIGWLQISPKCDYERVHQAMARANAIAHVATPQGKPVLASNISNRRAISLEKSGSDIHYDELPSAPIYNYARFIPWTLSVEEVYCGFREASEKSDSRQPVNLRAEWTKGDRNARVHPENRRGSDAQVAAYVEPVFDPEIRHHFPPRRRRWGPGVISRFVVAAGFALSLTWGTVGAAILVAFFTPTKGLACRSGSYLVYGVMSTLIWMLLVASSVLAHFSTFTVTFKGRYMHTKSTRLAGILAILFRRTAKVLAALNTTWIVLACLFQFASFFDRCWCNSSVFYLGKRAYNVIDVTTHDVAALNAPWLGGVALACGCAVLFLVFVNVLMNPPLPD